MHLYSFCAVTRSGVRSSRESPVKAKHYSFAGWASTRVVYAFADAASTGLQQAPLQPTS